MVKVVWADRRSAVLTPSSLACLSHIPTINLTAGCAHGCLYCYTRGYTVYPGEDRVIVYGNTLEKLKDELARKRTKPQAVYFSPSSDFFQPVPEVLALGYQILQFLFSQGIGVAFLSKGRIPDETLTLLLDNADKVKAQIGVITLDEDVWHMWEPNTASPEIRLAQIARLIAGGIVTEARLDPVIPGLTDTSDGLRDLFYALGQVGCTRAAASTLFLRPSVLESLKRNVHEKKVLGGVLGFYREAQRLAIHAEHSSVTALPRDAREEIYERLKHIADEHTIDLVICACKNPDMAHGTCNISGAWPKRSGHGLQRSLFYEES